MTYGVLPALFHFCRTSHTGQPLAVLEKTRRFRMPRALEKKLPLCCPCDDLSLYHHGSCHRCYYLWRRSRARFAGHREKILAIGRVSGALRSGVRTSNWQTSSQSALRVRPARS